ncbi:hypothetical protein [Candidatus Mycolicibacterium alkanivorans]|uniref:Antitoxin Xre/MbcA/ParS-like toxin-binding domain-containing protein n=1 Tax=Candidatus Mycolicibacterium alkanivorans TaxID=2954114 RepID=A0ABS9YQG6_9MYCO|nr:hypothetical protein [Candidatus Mycolicibacterium alkanivorans]MCI4673516.1 hypothetical protein [Candidatus Mycolicibacterium alkanivorans]
MHEAVDLIAANRRIRESARAVGDGLSAVEVYTEPAIARAVQAIQRSEAGLVQWLCAPTTYFDGDRPVDHLTGDPDRVVAVAKEALAVSW